MKRLLSIALMTILVSACLENNVKISAPLDGNDDAPHATLPDAHLIFVADRDANGNSLNGNLGGLTGADALCQVLADQAGLTQLTFKALLSRGEPLVEIESIPEAVNARDRIEITKSVVMMTSDTDYKVILDDPHLFWDSCSETNFYQKVDRSADHRLVENLPVLTATDCEGRALYFSCNGWTSNGRVDLPSDLDSWSYLDYYNQHQQLFSGPQLPRLEDDSDSYYPSEIFADSGTAIPCNEQAAVLCISQ